MATWKIKPGVSGYDEAVDKCSAEIEKAAKLLLAGRIGWDEFVARNNKAKGELRLTLHYGPHS